jgi:hypothetical protein
VLWQGYGFEEATWEPASSLSEAKAAVTDYKRTQAQLPQSKKNTRRGKRKMPASDSVGNAAAPQADQDRSEVAAVSTGTVTKEEDSSHKLYNHTPTPLKRSSSLSMRKGNMIVAEGPS